MADHIALYGKGGVGKTTLAANISAALVEAGFSIMLVGCDNDGDSCSLLHNGFPVPRVKDLLKERTPVTTGAIVHSGFKGVKCIELGSSSRTGMSISPGLEQSLKAFKNSRAVESHNPDYVMYDVSGESSFLSLSTLIRQIELTRIFVVSTAEYTSLQTANDLFGFLEQYNQHQDKQVLMGGLIFNNISSSLEDAFVHDFAYHANATVIGKIPRSLVVRQSELYGQTVIEAEPKSAQSYYYRSIANKMVDASMTIQSGNLPRSLSSERLRQWSLEWADRIYALENGLVTDGAAI